MKKITYSINFAFIGPKTSSNDLETEIFIEYLKKKAIETNLGETEGIYDNPLEFLLIYKEVPIKIRFFLSKSDDNIRTQFKKIPNIDVIVVLFDIINIDSLDSLTFQVLEEVTNNFSLSGGISILVGLALEEDNINNHNHVRENIIKKAKELEVLYAYELRKDEEEISQFFEKIFDDFLFKFHYSSPELFELAKLYGKALMERN